MTCGWTLNFSLLTCGNKYLKLLENVSHLNISLVCFCLTMTFRFGGNYQDVLNIWSKDRKQMAFFFLLKPTSFSSSKSLEGFLTLQNIKWFHYYNLLIDLSFFDELCRGHFIRTFQILPEFCIISHSWLLICCVFGVCRWQTTTCPGTTVEY